MFSITGVGGETGEYMIVSAGQYVYAIYTNYAGSIMLKYDTSGAFTGAFLLKFAHVCSLLTHLCSH